MIQFDLPVQQGEYIMIQFDRENIYIMIQFDLPARQGEYIMIQFDLPARQGEYSLTSQRDRENIL